MRREAGGKPGERSQEHVASFPISSVCQRPTFSAAWAPGGPRAVRSLPPAWPCACVLPTQPAALASRISGLFCGGYSPGDHSLVKLNPGGRGGKDSCSRLAFQGVKIPAGTALPALWAKPQPARPAPLPCQRGQRDCGCRSNLSPGAAQAPTHPQHRTRISPQGSQAIRLQRRKGSNAASWRASSATVLSCLGVLFHRNDHLTPDFPLLSFLFLFSPRCALLRACSPRAPRLGTLLGRALDVSPRLESRGSLDTAGAKALLRPRAGTR